METHLNRNCFSSSLFFCFDRHFEFSRGLPLYTCSQTPVPGSPFPVPRSPCPVPRSPFPVPGISNIRLNILRTNCFKLPPIHDLIIEGPGQCQIYRGNSLVFSGCPSFRVLALRLKFRQDTTRLLAPVVIRREVKECEGAVTLGNFSCNLSRNFVATQVERCDTGCLMNRVTLGNVSMLFWKLS